MRFFLFVLLIASNIAFSQSFNSIQDLTGKESSVTEIDLSNSGLTAFPTEILKCKNLKVLNLSNNGLTDLPAELSKMESLTHLNLSENEGLDSDDLTRVFFESTFLLEELNLAGCDLLYLPDEIGLQNNLKILNVSNNNLTALPYRFISLNQIREVDLSNNYFYDLSGIIKFWWFLESADISNNSTYLSGATLMELSYAKNLQRIALDNLTSFPLNTPINIKELRLENSYISSFQVSESPIKIKKLEFDNCNFDVDNYDEEAVISQRFDKITFINIDVKYLERMQFLKADSLSFKNCELKKEMFDNLNQTIKHIDLRSIKLSAADIDYIKEANPSIQFYFKEQVEPMPKINAPFKNLVQAAEVKSVNSQQASTVTFKDVAVKIPADAFITKDGRQYNGAVNIAVKSYMNPTDILLSGIPMTMNNGDETMMFSSGGMIDIRGQSPEGEELALQKPLDIAISSPNADPSMNLYEMGSSTSGDSWEEIGKDEVIEPFKLDQRLVDSVANQNFDQLIVKSVVDLQPRLVPVIENDRENERNGFSIKLRTLQTSDPLVFANDKYQYLDYNNSSMPYFQKHSFQYYGDSAKHYKQLVKAIADTCNRAYRKLKDKNRNTYSLRGPNFIQDFSLTPNLEKDIFELTFRFKGKKITIPVVLTNRSGNIKREIKLNSKFYKGYKKEIFKSDMKAQQAMRKIVLKNRSIVREREINREKSRQRMLYEKATKLKRNFTFGVASEVLNSSLFRSFRIPRLGLFNCDMITRMINPQRIVDSFRNMRIKFVSIVDFDKNSVIRFTELSKAVVDWAATTAIVIFLTNNKVGVIKRSEGVSSKMKEMDLDKIKDKQQIENLLK